MTLLNKFGAVQHDVLNWFALYQCSKSMGPLFNGNRQAVFRFAVKDFLARPACINTSDRHGRQPFFGAISLNR